MSLSREKKGLLFLGLIFVILVAAVIVVAVSLRTDPVADNLRDDQVIKTLVVVNDGNGNALSTDVFVYYPVTQKGALFDIAGNTGAIYKSLGRVDRIDAIYRELGINVYRSEIAKLIDQTIPFTLEISLDDLGKLTDLLGGMKVFVPSPVDATGENGERWLLPSGAVTLDGDKIQTYILYRLADETDSVQSDRRQDVVVALFSAIRDKKNIIFTKKNFPAYASLFKANIDSDALYTLLLHFSNVDADRLSPQSITGSLRSVDGQTLLFPYYNGQLIKDVVKQRISMLLNNNNEVQTRVYVVEIQNGTGQQGLARNTSALLQNAGYDILQAINADRDDYEHTVIINHIGNTEAAETLGNFITCKNIEVEKIQSDVEDRDNVAQVDFTLILGKDFDGRYVRGGYKPEPKENTESETDSQNTAE